MKTSVSAQQRFTKTNPCPICGGWKNMPQGIGERCTGFKRGKYVYCSREEYAGTALLIDSTTPATWRHKVDGCSCGIAHAASANGQVRQQARTQTLINMEDISPLDWWEGHTGVPRDEWEILGCDEDDTYVYFDFPGVDGRKRRKKGTKDISWVGFERPPVWPLPEDTLPKTIGVAEGESDCGVTRHCGFHTFTTTKGADGTGEGGLSSDVFRDFKERGAKRVIVFSDAGSSGREYRDRITSHAHAAGLAVSWVDLTPHYDLTRVEKDARSVYLRVGRTQFLEIVKEQIREVASPRPQIDHLDDLFAWADEDLRWLIQGLVLPGTKTLIGAPTKSLKTWFTLHLVACCSTSSPLLGVPEYAIENPVRTLLVEEEGERQMFGRRVRKVLNGIGAPVVVEPIFRFRRGFDLLDYAQVTDLIQVLDDEEIDLLILDPLQRITPGVDENSNSDMRRVWDAVNRIVLERPGTAVIVVAHNRKGDDLGLDAVRGASLSTGEQDLVISLRKEKDFTRTETTYRGTLALTLEGRELPQEFTKEGGAMEVEYLFDSEDDSFVMRATGDVVVTVRTSKKVGDDNETAVFEAIRAMCATTSQGVTKDDVRSVTHLAPRTIEKHLARLTESGRLTRTEVPKEKGGVKAVWEVAHDA